jgi:beta-glucosidase-like glycosyl hydrolase
MSRRVTVEQMTLEEKIAQLFVLRIYGDRADTVDADAVAKNQAAYGLDNAAELVTEHQPGGIAYFRFTDNVHDAVQVAELSNGIQRAALESATPRRRHPIPVLIAADHEGGRVVRMSPPAVPLPSAAELAQSSEAWQEGDRAGTYVADHLPELVAILAARELRALGVHQNYAPVADVNINPDNPVIGDRSFGTDPLRVAAHVAAQVRGYQHGGVAATVKHFPGHGDTAVDTHSGQAVITHTREEWEKLDLPPFRAAIEAGVDAVMTGHLVFPELDPTGEIATTSYPIISELLRGELGFDGVVATDGLGMDAAVLAHDPEVLPLRALQAGVDQLVVPADGTFSTAAKAIHAAVMSGELSRERIDESVTRILRLKAKYGLFSNPLVDPQAAAASVGSDETQREMERLLGALTDESFPDPTDAA